MRIVAVIGPPCSGKTTYVQHHRGPHDLIIDWDHLAVALGSQDPHTHPEWLKPFVRAARTAIYAALQRHPIPGTAWVISTYPPPLPVHRTVILDTDHATCLARATAANRAPHTIAAINDWFTYRRV